MGENWRFWVCLSVLCAGSALLTVLTVVHTIGIQNGGIT